jgi:1-acyl-sn-glycerol-3-phosphate acyltransferase
MAGARGLVQGARSVTFVLAFLAYLVFFMGLLQRLVIIPATWAFPRSAAGILAPWVRLQARNTLRLLRGLAGVQVSVAGRIDTGNCIVVMNHQSLMDIPIGFSLVPGALALIPTRRRYAWGIPGVSPFARAAGLPLIGQTARSRRADLAAMARAIERTRTGETSLFIFPEGHRTRDGSILPFMPSGLQLALTRAPRPVYCVVSDGGWRIRTLADTVLRVAGARIQVRVLGPFEPPADAAEITEFSRDLRSRMVDALDDMRRAHAA